jgi:succinyl-CoA synthetase beta subunit
MNLHEYQAKAILAQYGIPTPRGFVLESAADAARLAKELKDGPWILKAQAHTGGRGKAGGVRKAADPDELQQAASSLIGSRLVTNQTGPSGLPVEKVLVESITPIAQEFYLSLLVDRAKRRVVVVASASGGMDIEAVAAATPEKILSEAVDPGLGLMPFQSRKLSYGLGLSGDQAKGFMRIVSSLYRLFMEIDASLLEINPLAFTRSGEWLALDAKLSLDDNALERHAAFADLRDEGQEDPTEARARKAGLSYVQLHGDIGCMVNGAGLAMATMDLIQHLGGKPANFLDVGGNASVDRVTEAFRLIQADARVRSVLVNIFGGIVRCDLIAEGIIGAVKATHLQLPVIARLRGKNAELGQKMLEGSGLNLLYEHDLTNAAKKAIFAANAPPDGGKPGGAKERHGLLHRDGSQ